MEPATVEYLVDEPPEIEIDGIQQEPHEVIQVIIQDTADDVQDGSLIQMQAGELGAAEEGKPAQQQDETEGQSSTGTKQRSRNGGPPGLITMLITKFREGILSHWDRASREAIMENKDFEDPAVFGRVKLAVTSMILQWLQEHSDQGSVPTLQFFNSILAGTKVPGNVCRRSLRCCRWKESEKVLFKGNRGSEQHSRNETIHICQKEPFFKARVEYCF